MALASSLVSYYKLDTTSDSVGSNHLTNNNSVTFVAGKIGNGASSGTSNTNKSLSIASSMGIGGGACSMSVWIQLTTEIASGTYSFFTLGDASVHTGYRIYYDYNGGTRRITIARSKYGIGDQVVTSNVTMGTTNWYHLALTYDTSTVIGYVNGISIGSVASSGNGSGGGTTISGFFNDGNGIGYGSAIADEAGLWSRALSADEVSQLFNSGRGNAYPLTDTPSLYGGISYWKLDESSGNASDSINSNTLTNTGTATYGSGKINNGIDFGSSNTTKYLSVDSTLGMIGSDAKSYSFWVKINTAPSSGVQYTLFRHLYGGSAVGNYSNVSYYNNSGTFEVRIPTSPGGSATTQTLTVGTWYHFVVVVPVNNTGNITCYFNGTSFSTTANWSQNYALTTRLVLGADHAFSDKASCMIDEFSVFSRALSSTEVTALYNGGSGNQYPWVAPGTTYTLTLGTGYYNLTGQSNTLNRSIHMKLATGYYTLTGFATTVQRFKTYLIQCATGFYNLTGFQANVVSPLHTVWNAIVVAVTSWLSQMRGQ